MNFKTIKPATKRPTEPTLTFNAEQLEQLSQFDQPGECFRTVLDASYIRPVATKDMDMMLDIYKQAKGVDFPIRRGCPKCVMNFVKTMALAYRRGIAERGQS